jgi:molecular chaperone DnaK (HSP70)
MSSVPSVVDTIKGAFKEGTVCTICPINTVLVGVTLQGAILGGIRSRAIPQIRIRVTVPRSIGFSMANGRTKVMIRRGELIPATKSMTTTTSQDNQKSVGFSVVEGESRLVKDNKVLGKLRVSGIENAPKGVPKIEITMSIDEDGLLMLHATDLGTGVEITTSMQSGTNLSAKQLEEMIQARRAEQHKTRKRDAWKRRVTRYVAKLAKIKSGAAMPLKQRKKLGKLVAAAEEWIGTHQAEESADVYIKKYFQLRQLAQALLPET